MLEGGIINWPTSWTITDGEDGVFAGLGCLDNSLNWPSSQLPDIFISLFCSTGIASSFLTADKQINLKFLLLRSVSPKGPKELVGIHRCSAIEAWGLGSTGLRVTPHWETLFTGSKPSKNFPEITMLIRLGIDTHQARGFVNACPISAVMLSAKMSQRSLTVSFLLLAHLLLLSESGCRETLGAN